jgi:hypothetical protein
LHHCSDRRFLSTGDRPFPIDPDVVAERLERLMPRVGGSVDAIWQFLLDPIDPKARLAGRIKQKMYLARYARESVFVWEHRDIGELDAYFAALVEIISKENELSRVSEDR